MPTFPGQTATDHPIVADLGNGLELVASACATCGSTFYPPRELCPNDQSSLTPVSVSRRGIIYQAVRVDLAPAGFEGPYFAAYVDMPEVIRVFGLLDWPGDDPPEPGRTVECTIGTVRTDPVEVVGPRFRVVAQ